VFRKNKDKNMWKCTFYCENYFEKQNKKNVNGNLI
jgi:hypothetical protein